MKNFPVWHLREFNVYKFARLPHSGKKRGGEKMKKIRKKSKVKSIKHLESKVFSKNGTIIPHRRVGGKTERKKTASLLTKAIKKVV
ncbi:MAG: hypothetical protein U9N04_01000 [Patescibacteria group bacterium]|nr:hypothetical protein [Patescibacteria group bacterium]